MVLWSIPRKLENINIMTLEFYHIILAIELWGLWRNHSILLFTDNEALVEQFLKIAPAAQPKPCLVPHQFQPQNFLEYVTILANAALAPSTQAQAATWKTFDSFCTEIMNQSLQPPISSWRVGDNKNAPNDNVLLLHDVSLSYVQGKAAEVQVCFRKFKRNVRGMPKTILFSHGTAMESAVVAMVEYLKVRPYSVPTQPLFCSVDATPLHRPDFDRILHKCLASCGLDSSRYKGHSFRIGAATDAAERGLSDSQIRSIGR
ncbi:unnamed protein product [Mytilus coruscus]|uniref:Tyr recombinase domain-containing protein n=1 Tax=Mytilus coruscus TaxID=42192 RepID=A0A6J8CJ33_MYTCO|nr:unnamed protein product [Mytilus coruscus]